MKRDSYGRLLGYVRLADGSDFNLSIIATGHGFAYLEYPHGRMEEYRQAERDARAAARGLWDPEAGEPVPKTNRRRFSGTETVSRRPSCSLAMIAAGPKASERSK